MSWLDRSAVPGDVAERLSTGAIVAPAGAATIDLIGPGAVASFQGLLTNDVEKPGDGAFVYGALLTPKGMIVVDGWAARLGTRVRFTAPAEGRERATQLLQRSVPPRLARWSDRTTDHTVLRVAGAHALALAGAAGLPVPPTAGRTVEATLDGIVLEVARPGDGAPFSLQITAPVQHQAAVTARLARAGVLGAHARALELARILAGWPALASEVDEKTIPQEVRYDEIGGVSYTKGCYTGQETVSRLHFRGHANRHLRGVLFEVDVPASPAPDQRAITFEDREVGRVTSVAWVPWLDRWIGLGIVRREVAPGTVVRAAGLEAMIVALPFDLPSVGPA